MRRLLIWAVALGCRIASPHSKHHGRYDRDHGHRRGHEEDADHDRRRLACGPDFERLRHEPVVQWSIAQICRNVLLVAIARAVDLVGDARDRGGAVRRQRGHPDGHADHACHRHGCGCRAERTSACGLHGGRGSRSDREPEAKAEDRGRRSEGIGRHVRAPGRHPDEAAGAEGQTHERYQAEGKLAGQEAREQRAQGHRPGQRSEHHPLLGGAAVQDPVDEDGSAHDRRGHAVAGQQRDQRRRAEHAVGEQARIEERVRPAQAVDDRAKAACDADCQQCADRQGDRHPEDLVAAADEGDPEESGAQSQGE